MWYNLAVSHFELRPVKGAKMLDKQWQGSRDPQEGPSESAARALPPEQAASPMQAATTAEATEAA